MSADLHRQSGPDFLEAVADANLAHGLDTNAAEFRARAADWRTDRARIETLEAEVASLRRQLRNAAELQRLLGELHDHLQAANDAAATPGAVQRSSHVRGMAKQHEAMGVAG